MKTVRGSREEVTHQANADNVHFTRRYVGENGTVEAPQWGAAVLVGGVLFLFAATALAAVLGGWS